jgi:hypothetical protein
VISRAGLDDVEWRKFLTLPGLELRPLGRPVRSQSIYRLRYPGQIGVTHSVLEFMLHLKFKYILREGKLNTR